MSFAVVSRVPKVKLASGHSLIALAYERVVVPRPSSVLIRNLSQNSDLVHFEIQSTFLAKLDPSEW